MVWIVVFIMIYLYFSIPFNRFAMKISHNKPLVDQEESSISIYNAFSRNGKLIGIMLVALQVIPLLTIIKAFEIRETPRAVEFGILFVAMLGNMYPIFNQFKGSKGRTLLIWGLLYLVYEALIVLLLVWMTTYKITRNPKLGTTINAFLLPLIVFIHERNVTILLLSISVSILVLLNDLHKASDFSSN